MDELDVVQVTGSFGVYHGIITIMACLRALPVSWTNLMSPLMAADVDHWCAAPNTSIPSDWWKQNGLPRADGSSQPDGCSMFAWVADPDDEFGLRIDRSQTLACTNGFEYNRTRFGLTATEEWQLICGDSWKISAMQSIVMIGSIVGVVVFGRMSDKCGRKFSFYVSLVLLLSTGSIAAFAQSYIMFNTFRFVMAAATSGMTAALVTAFMEILSEADRIYMNIGFGIGYNTGVMFIPLLSYFLVNFRYMQLAIGLSGLVLVPFFWLMHESPKWLVAKHRFAEAERVIVRILKMNRRPVPDMLHVMPKLAVHVESESAAASRNLGFVDIMKVPILRRTAMTVGLNWFCWSTISYYFAVNAHRLPGNPHLNFAISTFAEFPSAFISMYLIRRCRRRQTQIFNIAVAAVIFTIVFFLDNSYELAKVWGNMLARLFVNNYGFIVWVSVHEIYPTPLRAAGYASAMITSRIGAAFAPFIKDIGDWTHHTVPCGIIVGLCVVIIACVTRLPETLNRRLPDTIDDVKAIYARGDGRKLAYENEVLDLYPQLQRTYLQEVRTEPMVESQAEASSRDAEAARCVSSSSTTTGSSSVASLDEADEDDYTESDSLETTVPSFISTGEDLEQRPISYEFLEHRFVNVLPEDEALRELSLKVLYHTWKLDRKLFKRQIALIDQVVALLPEQNGTPEQLQDAVAEAAASGRSSPAGQKGAPVPIKL